MKKTKGEFRRADTDRIRWIATKTYKNQLGWRCCANCAFGTIVPEGVLRCEIDKGEPAPTGVCDLFSNKLDKPDNG